MRHRLTTSLTRRFLLVVLAGSVLVTAVFVVLQERARHAADARLRDSVHESLQQEWRQIVTTHRERMAATFREFTRDAATLHALSSEDSTAARTAIAPSYNRLYGAGVVTGLVVASARGTVLFNASDPGTLGMPLAALDMAMAQRTTISGLEHTLDGRWGIVHAMPVFDAQRAVLGGVLLYRDMGNVIDDRAASTDNSWLLSDHRRGRVHSAGELANSEEVMRAAQKHGARTLDFGDRSVQIVTIELVDTDGSEALHLTKLTDVTAAVGAARAEAVVEYAVLGVVMAGILGWIFQFVVRASAALSAQQQQQIVQLEAANHDKERAVQELQRVHAELWQTFAAKEAAQRENARMNQLNQVLLESAGEGIVGLDNAGRIVFANPAAERLLGYGRGELNTRAIADFADARVNADLAAAESCVVAHAVFERRDHLFFPVAYTCAPVVESDVRSGSVLTFNDISAQKAFERQLVAEKDAQAKLIKKLEEAQSQLLQAEKMASIGQLAAGVAHEINNPVGYVSSNLHSLRTYVEELIGALESATHAGPGKPQNKAFDLAFIKDDLQQLLRESEEGVERVKQIVRDLKDFSHVDSAGWAFADIHRGLDSTLNIVRNEIKYKADVIKDYGTLLPVECMVGQLNQVFTNLLVNAAQAIESRGTIWLRTGQQDKWVWVEVEDNGKGIPAAYLPRIFEPFFTTKPVGKGTGLGLSVSYGIVEKHGGRIEVASEVGKGTRFRVWLPVTQAQREASA